MDPEALKAAVEQQVERSAHSARHPGALLSRTMYFGTVGLMLVLPIVAGAYFGSWLDTSTKGFSFSWTISLILLGVFTGGYNVAMFIKRTSR